MESDLIAGGSAERRLLRLYLAAGTSVFVFGSFGFAKDFSVSVDSQLFIKEHCVECHGEKKQKGDRRFDGLGIDFSDENTAYDWQEILDMINLGDMPPEDEPRPPVEDTLEIVDWISGELELAYELHGSSESAGLRRLNRHEYLNTIRDLCGLNIQSFDPTQSFPPDERFEGFENIGSELVLSDYLLERYLEAASATIEKAIDFGAQPSGIRELFTPDDLTDRTFHFRPQVWFEINVDGRYLDVGHGDTKSYRVYADRFSGVPADGFYMIRIRAAGVGRVHPYDTDLLGVDPEEPIKMEVMVTDPAVGYPGRRYNASDRIVATIPLEDDDVEVYEVRAWMDKGFVPIIRYANGPQPIKGVLSKIAQKYHLDVMPSNWRDGVAAKPSENQEIYFSDVYAGPRIRLYDYSIEGPEAAAWPVLSHQTIIGKASKKADQVDVNSLVEGFATRAFRRPARGTEVERYFRFYQNRLAMGESAEVAIKTTLKAILSSPNFLYAEAPLDESAIGSEVELAKLKQYAIASRLSYFLWSSMPDDHLFEAAERGLLTQENELRDQTLRMLEDPKARAFVDRFTDSWLHLNDLGSMPPDSKKFKVYHDRQLKSLMKEETRLFFEDILKNNRSIDSFIDSDFAYLNRYMADLYGIEGVSTDEFRRVDLPKDSPRGGVLGQASILTTTSNGVETSPVVRGIWVLENILGTPPPPPPVDVEPLEPDVRGATTIREQLAKHRKVETCAECHRKIDPIGFALEGFDPIGNLRRNYKNDAGKAFRKIDTSGKLVGGETFEGIDDLKDLLLERKDQFARCLVEKILTYSLGRELGFGDRPAVNALTEELADRGYGLRDLVELVATSEIFRK
ncbi:MAG: DUF1592 domain-containing protein [Opitutales bacterium]|jgi:hypothetical protein|nr:DUF1592 domain-containing protein [Opitutales bacterium]MBT5814149.1 DUF1592 domain-containing protein [Opitutales bacterium]